MYALFFFWIVAFFGFLNFANALAKLHIQGVKNRESDGVAETFYCFIPHGILKFANALANLPVRKEKILKSADRFYCFRLWALKKHLDCSILPTHWQNCLLAIGAEYQRRKKSRCCACFILFRNRKLVGASEFCQRVGKIAHSGCDEKKTAALSRFFETASPLVYASAPILPMALAKLPWLLSWQGHRFYLGRFPWLEGEGIPLPFYRFFSLKIRSIRP